MVILTREQLEERLAVLHKASLELVGDLTLDVVLQRIVELAREQAGARYAALGVVDEKGALIRFIPIGMEPELLQQLEHPPVGKGMIGALMRERKTIRIPEISEDSRSVGFPENHPVMHPFLGVPIMLGKRLLGLIYLTDKIDTPEFTMTDERVIETLAAYAAIAINNARMYQGLEERDHVLSQRNEDLALVDDLAAAMASSLEVDQILKETLTRIMEYLEVETGEIFMGEESGQTFRRSLHLGEAVKNFFTKDIFSMGEGPVGMVAESGRPLLSFYPGKEIRYFDKEVSEKGFCCLVCIPLTTRNQVVGVLCLASRRSTV